MNNAIPYVNHKMHRGMDAVFTQIVCVYVYM